jgi:hypothetical protein
MTEPQLRHQTRLWLTAISADLRSAIQQEADRLRSSVEERIAVLEGMASASDKQLDELGVNVAGLAEEMAQKAVTEVRQQMEAAAQAELTTVRDRLQADLETMRTEFETDQAALQAQLAETERDISAIRQKRDEHEADLHQTRERVAMLEEANGQAALHRKLAEARLEEEVQRRVAIEKQLESSRQELVLAKAEAESSRLEAHLTNERNRTLEKTVSPASDVHGALAALKNGIEELSSARRDEILSKLVEQLASHCSAVAVFAVTSQGLQLWKARAGDSDAALPARGPSLDGNSPVAQAVRQGVPVRVDVSRSDKKILGIWDKPLGRAMALPILGRGRVLAVVYAENPPGQSGTDVRVLDLAMEILVSCVNRRLHGGPTPELQPSPAAELQPQVQKSDSAPLSQDEQQFAISRKARRVKIQAAGGLLVDGVASVLVDISTLGAQVLSPTTLRPNRVVRLMLRNGNSECAAEGRIVWAQLESSSAEASARYRAGVLFTNMDPGAINALVTQQGLPPLQAERTAAR